MEYLDFLKLLNETKIVFTDSGGLQEEASITGTPCITLRTTTERQITMIKKVNFLAGYEILKVKKATKFFFNKRISKLSDFGKGEVSDKIYNKLKTFFNEQK